MNTPDAKTKQIREHLASARCEQDLDLELARIEEADWKLFLADAYAQVEQVAQKEPQRASYLQSLLTSYLERRALLKRNGCISPSGLP